MVIKCIKKTIKREEEFSPLLVYEDSPDIELGELEIGEEYLVMGMIHRRGGLFYLFNSGRVITVCPVSLFEVVDPELPVGWYFRAFTPDYYNYINIEAAWGYYELCFVDTHFEELIEFDENAHRIFFAHKKKMYL
jgi:hypothetical protein